MTKFVRMIRLELGVDESGQALAEFALVMPLLFLLMAGILGFGRAWNIQQVVVDAAREGARLSVVQDDKSNVESDPNGWAVVETAIRNRLHNAAISDDDITITHSPAAQWRKPGEYTVTVSVTYSLPLLSAIMNWATGTPNFNLHSSTTMRNEF